MKKLFLTTAICAFSISTLFAQTNMDFELWGPTPPFSSNDPTGWGTLNLDNFLGPVSTFQETASPGEGLSSVQLVTTTGYAPFFGVGLDTLGGFLALNGDLSSNLIGGIPYTQKPISMDFLYKSNIMAGDTGVLLVQLSHWDVGLDSTIVDAQGIITFQGAPVASWTLMNLPITYYTSDTPDTLIILATSSAEFLFGSPASVPGSELFLDSFALVFPPPPCGIDSTQIAVIIVTGGFGSEVSWSITDAAGAQVDTGFGYASTSTYYDTLCIKNCESYDFNMYDLFGDGWNGGIYTIVLTSTGDTLSAGGLLGGSFGSDPFSYCNLPDAGIAAILSPASGCSLSASETVEVVIQNYSAANTINLVDVSYSIDGGPAITETVISVILPGNSMNYAFSALADLSAPGIHTIDAWTDLLSDANNTNDSLNGFIVNNIVPSLSFNDSIYITDIIPAGIQATICTNGLVSNMLDTCYQLTAVVIDSLSHTWTSDLDIYLISPNGDTLELSTGNGGDGDDYYNVVFTDTASINISTISSGGFGAGGYYHTEDPTGLASVTGFDPNGEWNLWITDAFAGDEGAIYKWHLEFTDFTPDAGASGTLNACDTETAVDLSTGLGGTPDGGGAWNDDDATGALTGGLFDASAVGAGAYNFTYIVTGCINDSATVTVTVTAAPTAGSNGTLNACDTETAVDLSTGLGGTPDGGGTWNDDDATGALTGGLFDASAVGTGVYDFTYIVTGCVDDSATVTVTVTAAPTAGSNGTLDVCDTETAVDLSTGLGGTPDGGGAWNDDDATGALTGGLFDASSVGTGFYNFTYLVSGIAPCTDDSATVTVNVTTAPSAGVDSTLSVCNTETAVDLSTGLGGTPDGGGAWNDDDATGALTGGLFDASAVSTGTYDFTYIVTGCVDDSATVTVTVTTCSLPTGSICSDPIVIGSLPYNQTGLTTCGFGDDYSSADACGSSYMNGDDYIFTYTPPTDTCISITLTNTATYTGVFLLDGCPDAGATCIASNEQAGGNPSIASANLTGGVTYYIVVSTWEPPQCTAFDINIDTAACPPPPPTGSICSDPVVIGSLPYNQTGLTTCGFGDDYSSADACGSDYMGGDDFVFAYTPPTDTCISITLTNTATWTGVFLLDGCPDAGAACIASDEQSGGNPSIASANLTGGVTYYIVISTWFPPQCTAFDIIIDTAACPQPPPPNDTCGGALVVTVGTYTGTTVGLGNDVAPTCGTGDGSGGGVWYKYTGTGNAVNASLCGSGYDTKIRVFTGTCGSLVCETGNDDFCGPQQSEVSWCSVPGTDYYILVHGWSGEEGSFTLTITETLTPVTSVSESICSGDSILLGGTYQTTSGTYYDTLTASNGCDSIIVTSLTIDLLPAITINPSPGVVCNYGDTVMLLASGASSYTWSPSAGLDTTGGAIVAAFPSSDTIYTVVGTSSAGCVDSTTVSVQLSTSNPIANFTSATSTCEGGNIDFTNTSTNATSFSWTFPGGTTSDTTLQNPTVTYSTAGTFDVTLTAYGCSADSTIVTFGYITVNPTYSVNASASICDNDSLQLPGGAYVNTAGIYYDTLTTVNGCDSVIVTNLVVTSGPNAGISSSNNISCFGSCDGDATVAVSGGAIPYTYLWNDPLAQTTQTADSLCVGTYTITVTDSNGCITTSAVTLSGSPPFILTTAIDNNITCNGDSTGGATVSVTGGTAPYNYLWSSGDTTLTSAAIINSVIGLPAGTYTVLVIDANGCSNMDTITLDEPLPIDAAPLTSAPDTNNTGVGTASISSVSGGTPLYNYNWTPSGGTGSTATGLTAGIYTVTVDDANGCSYVGTVSVSNINVISIFEINPGMKFDIYPNPNKGQFIVEITNTKKEDYLIEVRNIIGQIVYTEEIHDVSGNFIKEINLSERGAYFINISSSSGTTTKKLIVY